MKYVPAGPPRYAHQKQALRRIIETRGVCALLMDPGTGKTATVLDYCSILALKNPRRETRVLVIAPLVAIDTWVDQSKTYVHPGVSVWAEALGGSIKQRAEALAARGGRPFAGKRHQTPAKQRRMAPRALHSGKAIASYLRGDTGAQPSLERGPDSLGTSRPSLILTSVNLDTFSSRASLGSGTVADLMLKAVERYQPDLIVVDESHKIKGASSNVSRLLARIGRHSPRRLILTGTVMPHSPLDVFGQWRFLEPTAFGKTKGGTPQPATWSDFQHRFADFGGYLGKEVKRFKNLDEMNRIMSKNSVVVKKSDAMELPPTTETKVTVHLSPKELSAYTSMKKELVTALSSGTVTAGNRLTQMMRLRQITSGFIRDDAGQIIDLGSSKAKVIAGIVSDTLAGENRVVIFCAFVHEIDLIVERLKSDPGEVLVIRGSTSKDERIRLRKRFGSDDQRRLILVAQIQTLSLAVNELVTASHAIFGSLTLQRDELIQAQDRLNRIGQKRPVTFWYPVAPGTVDTVTLSAHKSRTSLEAKMLQHIGVELPDDVLQ